MTTHETELGDDDEGFDESRLGPAFDAMLDAAVKLEITEDELIEVAFRLIIATAQNACIDPVSLMRDLAEHTEELDDAGAFEDAPSLH